MIGIERITQFFAFSCSFLIKNMDSVSVLIYTFVLPFQNKLKQIRICYLQLISGTQILFLE